MERLVFTVHRAEEGGYWAEAQSCPIFTQGETLDELAVMINDAVGAYFADGGAKPHEISWVFAAEDAAA